jgi:uroporphyrinogen decarboxylase
VVDLYKEAIGMNYMSPFEAAAGCDIVKSGEKWPDMLLSGGIDKRVLAATTEEIDGYLDGVLPVLHRRGGYIPTSDHGVPEEVPFENYIHFRRRIAEYA